MSLFDGDGIDDAYNLNVGNGGYQPPKEVDDSVQIFGDVEQADDGENQLGEALVAPVKVHPKKRNVINPRPRLNVEVLRGPRGLHTIQDYFKDIKFKGKGKEKEDLDEVIRRLQHWGHRMYPTYKFDDVLTNIERLGKKKPLQVHMSRYRLGMLESMKNHREVHDEDDDVEPTEISDEPYDEFDALLDEQIAISKVVPRTPTPSTSKFSIIGQGNLTNASVSSSSFTTPSFAKGGVVVSTPHTGNHNFNDDNSDLAIPLPPSRPSTPLPKHQLSAEQLARTAENRRLAQERLAAKRRNQQETQEPQEFVPI